MLADDEPLVIETDLTEEEHALIADSVERYHRDPTSFTSLGKYLVTLPRHT
jgi:hypothetical protein